MSVIFAMRIQQTHGLMGSLIQLYHHDISTSTLFTHATSPSASLSRTSLSEPTRLQTLATGALRTFSTEHVHGDGRKVQGSTYILAYRGRGKPYLGFI
jgi:hypothetical protein